MDNHTNTRHEATMKIIAFHVFIMISIFLTIAGIAVNSLLPSIK
jgi:type IV secretory pathway component VirB8